MLDVANEAQAREAAADVVAKLGRIDVLVNNAGYGLLSAVEEASDDEIKRNYETNVFGLLKVTRAVLPYMRKQRAGHVINFSSVGGLVGSGGLGYQVAEGLQRNEFGQGVVASLAILALGITLDRVTRVNRQARLEGNR